MPMKLPERITIALDDETKKIFETLKNNTKLSQSELIRTALRFYSQHKETISENKKINTYVELLSSGEHIIIDVDHWYLFLKQINESGDNTKFWENCKTVAKSHAEQFSRKSITVKDILIRFEACNFFKLNTVSDSEFIIVLSAEVTKKFIKNLLEDLFKEMGFKAEIREDFAKIRVRILK